MDELEAERDLLRRIRTEGVIAAYEAALHVCRDAKAPANAKATASGVLFRVGGYFDRREGSGWGKAPHEMNADELQAEIDRMQRASKSPAPNVFD